MGLANPAIGLNPVPKNGLSPLTLSRLNRLNASATKSSPLCPPTLKYLSARKSTVAKLGVRSELRAKPNGRDESGNAWFRFESTPVSGLTGRPLPLLDHRHVRSLQQTILAIRPRLVVPLHSESSPG